MTRSGLTLPSFHHLASVDRATPMALAASDVGTSGGRSFTSRDANRYLGRLPAVRTDVTLSQDRYTVLSRDETDETVTPWEMYGVCM